MAELAIGAGLLMAGGQLFGAYSSAQSLKMQARMAEVQAAAAEQQAAESARRIRRQGRQQLGLMRAGIGASGINVEGSPLAVLQDSAVESELAALTAIYQGDLQATGFRMEAKQAKKAARNTLVAGSIGAGASLLTAGNDYTAMKRTTG